MTEDDALYRFRPRALALATELGNVRAACRAMGIHPSTFYRWRGQVLRFGPEILRPRERRRPRMANQTSPFIEQRVVGGLRPRPPWVRADADRRRAPPGQVGRDRDLPERGAPRAPPPRPKHQRKAPGPCGRLRGPTRARTPTATAGAAPGRLPTRGDGSDGLLLHRQALRCQGCRVAVHGDRRGLSLLLGRAAPHAEKPLGAMDLRAGPSGGLGSGLTRLAPGQGDDGQRLRVPLRRVRGGRGSTGSSAPVHHAGRPQTNGVVERVQETIPEECWKSAFARYLIPKYTGLRLDLDRYLTYYNTDRAHTGRWTKGRTPSRSSGRSRCGHARADASPDLGDRTV